MEFKVRLRIPHRYLNPNVKCHWSAEAEQVRIHKMEAYYVGLDVVGNLFKFKKPRSKDAEVQRIYYFKNKRGRDKDNFDIMTKPYMDGFEKIGLFDNDCYVSYLKTEFNIDRKDPRLELIVNLRDFKYEGKI